MRKLTSVMLCIMMMLALVFSASALELDVAEDATAELTEEAVLAADTLSIPLEDENYGKLILFKDFEQENATNKSYAYMDTNYMSSTSVTHASASSTVVDNPVEGEDGKVLEVTGTGWAQFFVTFGDLYVKPGTYVVVYDYYSETSCGDFMERYFTNINHSGGTGKGDYLSISPGKSHFNTGEWITKDFSALTAKTLSDETGTGFTISYGDKSKPYYNTEAANLRFSQIGIMPNATSITYYLDNIKLYYMPDNAVVYKHGDSFKLVEYENGYVTMPSLSEVDATWTLDNFRVWTDGTNFYVPGQTYSCADMESKTLTPLAFEKELYNETKGELAALFSFDGKTSKTAPTFLNPEYFPNPNQFFSIRTDNVGSYVLADDTDGNKVMKVTVSKKGVYLFGYYWYSNIAAAPERVTLDYDMKIVSGAEALAGKTYHARFGYWGDPADNKTGNPSENYKWGSDEAFDATLDKWVSYSTYIEPAYGVGTFGAVPQVGPDSAYEIVMYHDNIAFYVKPSSFSFKTAEDGEIVKTVTMKGEATTYTFPTPSELGVEVENFLAWTDGKGHVFKAGETATYTNENNFKNSEFYPFSQAADMPAVISLFEGEKEIEVSKDSYAKAIDDDGRDVLYSHYWGSTWDKNNAVWTNDPRIYMFPAERFDASEYGTIEIMSKSTWAYNVTDTKNPEPEYVEKDSYSVTIYNCINEGHSYVGGSKLCSTAFPTSNEYNLLSLNAPLANVTYPWADTGWGFVVDINIANWGADTYVDYVRVYRNGITTVTYDTNAPEGVEETAILKEVEPDTGRGLGTGYLLKDIRPEIEGYVFKGWATSADSTETVEVIDLTGDTTVYAVWDEADKYVTTEMLTDTEIKGTGSNNGIRFKSTIKPSFKANLDEFGFLATREVLLPKLDENTYDYSALAFDFNVKGKEASYYVQGVAYDADGGKDVVNSETADGDIVYTTVLSGIPLDKKEEVMVVRPYAQYEINGKAVTIYGKAATGSLYETAKAIIDAGGEAYENNKTYIDNIVPDAQ